MPPSGTCIRVLPYQFTYGPRCPVARSILDRLGLKGKRLGTVFASVSPATVYRIRSGSRDGPDAGNDIRRQVAHVAQYRLRSESIEPNFTEAPRQGPRRIARPSANWPGSPGALAHFRRM